VGIARRRLIALTLCVAAPAGIAHAATPVAAASPVTVTAVGFTQSFFGHTSSTLTYGVELANTSRTEDAFGVKVTVSVVPTTAAFAHQPGTDSIAVLAVPAGSVFVVGNQTFPLLKTVRVERLRTRVTVANTRPRAVSLPTVSHVRWMPSVNEITGTVTNPYATPISAYDLTFYYVAYSRTGAIAGGGSDDGYTALYGSGSLTIAPRGSANFTVSAATPRTAAIVRLSVDPGYIPR
jgi:hypothetical protein